MTAPSPTSPDRRKRVIVTGASSGIGKATVERFAREGWDVALVARRETLMREIVAGLPSGNHLVCPGAYEAPETADRLESLIQTSWGNVDVLINNAGVSMSADILDAPVAEWRRPFDIMVDGAIAMARLAARYMAGAGRIVHVTSIHGERVEVGSGAYAMAKAAINHYCRALALELAPRGILVNAIAPGFIETPMSSSHGVNELETEWFKQNYVDGHHLPLRRAGQPEEIAGVAYFLAGPDASYITGQVITVDGGLTITF